MFKHFKFIYTQFLTQNIPPKYTIFYSKPLFYICIYIFVFMYRLEAVNKSVPNLTFILGYYKQITHLIPQLKQIVIPSFTSRLELELRLSTYIFIHVVYIYI